MIGSRIVSKAAALVIASYVAAVAADLPHARLTALARDFTARLARLHPRPADPDQPIGAARAAANY